MYQQIRHGLKNRTQQINNRCCFTAKFQRILCRIYFRHDFPEKQQQKSKHNRYEQKLKQLSIAKIYHAGKKEIAQHDYCYIDKVIRNKNGSKQTFRIIKQSSNA